MSFINYDPRSPEIEKTARLQRLVENWETFSYGISHDLRTPLRAIMGFSKVLIEEHGLALDAEGRDYLKRIDAASHQMDRLICDILNFTQTSQGDLVLVPIDPLSLIPEIIKNYPNLAPNLISITSEPSIPLVSANEAALVQCISNILGNAAKFGTPGIKPTVIISSSSANGTVRLSFRDNGIGIASEDHKRIFEMFERVNHAREGSGIGLCVVKRTIERMGGRIGVDSTLGNGTTLWLELAGIRN